MAKRTIETFEAARADAVIVNTSGCGAHMKAFGALLAGEPAWAARAAAFAAHGPGRRRVPRARAAARSAACGADDGDVSRPLPRRARPEDSPPATRSCWPRCPELRVVDLPESDWCCGSAGIYNLTQPEMADRLLRRKTRQHRVATGAEAVVTANPGCILQIQAGLRAQGLELPVLHLVEILDRAYGGQSRRESASEVHARRAQGHRAAQAVGCFVLTVSDTKTPETDTGGRTIRELLTAGGHTVIGSAIVRDEPADVARDRARRRAPIPRVQVVILTGGTGITSRDSTFEAVEALLDKRLPGFGELFRVLSYEDVGAAAMLSPRADGHPRPAHRRLAPRLAQRVSARAREAAAARAGSSRARGESLIGTGALYWVRAAYQGGRVCLARVVSVLLAIVLCVDALGARWRQGRHKRCKYWREDVAVTPAPGAQPLQRPAGRPRRAAQARRSCTSGSGGARAAATRTIWSPGEPRRSSGSGFRHRPERV